MKLDDLIKRGDVCLLCGRVIGDASACEACGTARVTPDELLRVKRALRVGRAGLGVLLACGVGMVAWACWAFGGANSIEEVAFKVFASGAAVLGSIFLVGAMLLLLPWILATDSARGLFHRPWRRRFVAVYPWVLIAMFALWTSPVWLGEWL